MAPRQLIRGYGPSETNERAQDETHLLVDRVADLLSGIGELLVEQYAPRLENHGLVLGRAQRDLDTKGRVVREYGLHVAQRLLGHVGYLRQVFDAQIEPVGVVGVDARFRGLLVAKPRLHDNLHRFAHEMLRELQQRLAVLFR